MDIQKYSFYKAMNLDSSTTIGNVWDQKLETPVEISLVIKDYFLSEK